jgi:hypothetical protein
MKRYSGGFVNLLKLIGYPDQQERAEILNVILKGERVEDNIDFGYII